MIDPSMSTSVPSNSFSVLTGLISFLFALHVLACERGSDDAQSELIMRALASKVWTNFRHFSPRNRNPPNFEKPITNSDISGRLEDASATIMVRREA
jgi:hypothetical protein